MGYRGVAIALMVGAGLWLGAVIAFTAANAVGGRTAGTGAIIATILFSGLIPALFFATVGALFWRQYKIDHRK